MASGESITTTTEDFDDGSLMLSSGDIGEDTTSPGAAGPGAVVIGASVGAVTFFLLLLVMCCVVIVVVVAKKKRMSTYRTPDYAVVKKKAKKPEEGITNAMYAYDGDIKIDIDPKNHDYSLPHDINSKQVELENSYAYAYASTERKVSTKSNFSQGTGTKPTKSKLSSRYGKEQTYMVPATEETALYAQIIDMRIPELSRTSIELREVIGTGNFGTVNQGIMKSTNGGEVVEVAVKTLKEGSGEQDRVKFLQEATIMGQFRHPNVVKVHGVVIEDEPVMIVLELLAKGDLRNHLSGQRYESVLSIDEHTLLSYCRQVASGMVYLSSKAFVHRDLAARNILLSEQGLCKIADFGLSRDLMDEEYYVSQGGKIPVKWTAPEALNYRKYSTASDVWSFGVLLFEIWSLGLKPYEGLSIPELLRKLDDGYRLAPPPGTPRAVYELMINTWDPITSLRPSFSDIMQQLSLPDTVLLQSSPDVVTSGSAKLGDELSCGFDLYTDLQNKYV